MNYSILVVDDREGIRLFIKETLSNCGYTVVTACNGKDAIKELDKKKYHLIITDLKMPEMNGMELLAYSKKTFPEIQVIMLTAHGTIDNAVDAMKVGAFDYLTKPLESPEKLRTIVTKALVQGQLHNPTQPTENQYEMIAKSPVMLDVVKMISKVAPTDTTVLLDGQSGTGKEVAARNIHNKSKRNKNKFVAINCAAISPQLIESELFGHEHGSFTGATTLKKGLFETAHEGTLFLDEIGELPLTLQSKLLRVLQERCFERVGGNETIYVDVRIIAATNKNLFDEVHTGNFREDLYHRVAVFPVTLPPLNKREGDILPIAKYLLTQISKRLFIPSLKLDKKAETLLLKYRWPGNIRQLSNALERAAIMCEPPIIASKDLSLDEPHTKQNRDEIRSNESTLKNIEKDAILNALNQNDGHRKKAAELLGISLRSLYNKLKQYNIE